MNNNKIKKAVVIDVDYKNITSPNLLLELKENIPAANWAFTMMYDRLISYDNNGFIDFNRSLTTSDAPIRNGDWEDAGFRGRRKNLRTEARFHGSAVHDFNFNAQDIVNHINQAQEIAQGNTRAHNIWSHIKKVDGNLLGSVDFKFKGSLNAFWARLENPVAGIARSNGGSLSGTGAFSRCDDQGELKLTHNKDWWLNRTENVLTGNITLKPVLNHSNRTERLMRGESDAAVFTGDTQIFDENDYFHVQRFVSNSPWVLSMNTSYFSVEVRQAIALAIDKFELSQLRDLEIGGSGTPIDYYTHYRKDTGPQFDPFKAKEIMKGQAPAHSADNLLDAVLLTTREGLDAANAIKRMLGEIFINVSVEADEALVDEILDSSNPRVLKNNEMLLHDMILTLDFGSKDVCLEALTNWFCSDGNSNITSYNNSAFDAIVNSPSLWDPPREFSNDLQQALELGMPAVNLGWPVTKIVFPKSTNRDTVYFREQDINFTDFRFVSANQKELSSLRIEAAPTKKHHVHGDEIDTEGMVVRAYYNNDEEHSRIIPNQFLEVRIINSNTGGAYLTVYYKEKSSLEDSANFGELVEKSDSLPWMTIGLVKIEVTRDPINMIYLEQECFDNDGMELTAHYGVNENSILESRIIEIEDNENLWILSPLFSEAGRKTIEITFGMLSTTLEIMVLPNIVRDWRIRVFPFQAAYTVGDRLNLDGIVVEKLYYGEGEETESMVLRRELELADFVRLVRVSTPSQSNLPLSSIQLGEHDIGEEVPVILSYGESDVSATFNITVLPSGITGLEIINQPTKRRYLAGEHFNTSGLRVIAHYSCDEIKREIFPFSNTNPHGYTIRSNRALRASDSHVIIEYRGPGGNHNTATASIPITVFQEGIDNSKINQTELKYSCSAGEASVNLFTDRMLFMHPTAGIGANSFQIEIAHVYNSHFNEDNDGIKTYMGKGFKLNVQQYLLNAHIDRMFPVYVDGSGLRHTFMPLSGDEHNRYYDTSGLGLILEKKGDQTIVSDEPGNKMTFDKKGRLINTISCHNDALRKEYIYNDTGQLVSVYDCRRQNHERIILEYSQASGLLERINCIEGNAAGGQIKQNVHFHYHNGKLIKIESNSGSSVFAYNTYGLMEYASSECDKSALQFKYNKLGSYHPDIFSIDSVVSGVSEIKLNNESNKKSIKSGAVNSGEALSGQLIAADNNYEISIPNANIQSRNLFQSSSEICRTSLTVTNQKHQAFANANVSIAYFFNPKGYTTSVLESTDSNNRFSTLEKTPGVSDNIKEKIEESNVLNGPSADGDAPHKASSERINGQQPIKFRSNHAIRLNQSSRKHFDEYRSNKSRHFKNYNISFWLKLNSPFINPQINITAASNNSNNNPSRNVVHDTGQVHFDNTAIDAWQFVTIPIRISERNIRDLQFSFSDGRPFASCLIADMRLVYSPHSRYMLNTLNPLTRHTITLDSVSQIRYKLNPNDPFTAARVREDFYMSEEDIKTTYINRYKARGLAEQGSKFILSLSDGTTKLLVDSVMLSSPDSGHSPIDFMSNLFGIRSNRARFFHEFISPDDDVRTCNYLSFGIENPDLSPAPLLRTQTIADRYPPGARRHKRSSTEALSDLKGRLLRETDEYGVSTSYRYDENGAVNERIISGQGTNETLVFRADDTHNSTTAQTPTSQTTTHFNNPLGHIEKTDRRGRNENAANTLSTRYTYNTKDRLEQVQNNTPSAPGSDALFGANHLSYDPQGRLSKASPKGVHQNGSPVLSPSYGFDIEYDKYSNPSKYFLTGGINNAQRRLLSSTTTEYSLTGALGRDTTTTCTYRHDQNNPDTVSTVLDSYGRTLSITETSHGDSHPSTDRPVARTTHFGHSNRQTLTAINGASEGAAEITRMTDPFENRTYTYTYDDFNNPTGYEIRAGLGGRDSPLHMSILATGANEVTYNDNDRARRRHSNVFYDDDKLLSPRIDRTTDNLPRARHQAITRYTYDALGRVIRKSAGTMVTLSSYLPGTLLKSSHRVETRVGTHEFNYGYDERGRIKQIVNKRGITPFLTNTYQYDNADRLTQEASFNGLTNYEYNPDGSLAAERPGSPNAAPSAQYSYNNEGRLTQRISRQGNSSTTEHRYFNHDNIGNCTHYNTTLSPQDQDPNMHWTRGSLLARYTQAGADRNTTAQYSYTNQGVRFRKVTGTIAHGTAINIANMIAGTAITEYFHDGDKLLEEHRSTAGQNSMTLTYLYDAEEMTGFSLTGAGGSISTGGAGPSINADGIYHFVKDAQGNVRALVRQWSTSSAIGSGVTSFTIAARYEYDAWGNCVTVAGQPPAAVVNTHPSFIGNVNPIRWKSQYLDTESGLYLIYSAGGARYYSPLIKQYLSASNPECVLANAGIVYGLNAYLICLTNVVNMCYGSPSGHTIESNIELAFDPPELSRWQRFWRSGWGIATAFVALIAAVLILPLKALAVAAVFVAVSLGVGGVIAGVRSSNRGSGFWDGLGRFITDNWSSSVALGMGLSLVSFGIGKAAAWIAGASTKASGLPSATKLAMKHTHNKKSKIVVLGKFEGGTGSFHMIAKKKKATYFHMKQKKWAKLYSKHGQEFMWDINQSFLKQQMAIGKTFKASHSISNANKTFLKEIEFLASRGIIITPL